MGGQRTHQRLWKTIRGIVALLEVLVFYFCRIRLAIRELASHVYSAPRCPEVPASGQQSKVPQVSRFLSQEARPVKRIQPVSKFHDKSGSMSAASQPTASADKSSTAGLNLGLGGCCSHRVVALDCGLPGILI